MYSPVAAPRHRQSSTSPQPKSTFQKELEATIKQRRSRGLATDVTPQESEDELASDDDLMAGFNMTSKAKSPSFDKNRKGSSALDAMFGRKNEDKDFNKHDNKTWKPPGQKASISTRRKGSALDSDEEDQSEEEKRWQPPGHKRSDSQGSDGMRNGHAMPEVRSSSRNSHSASRSSNPPSSEPRPRPRLKLKSMNSSNTIPSILTEKLSPLTSDPFKPPVSPGRLRFRKSRSQTPKSLLENGHDRPDENGRKKSPYDDLLSRKSPKQKKGLLSDSDDSDSDEVKQTFQKARKSPYQEKSDNRKSPMDSGDRKGPHSRKSPFQKDNSLDDRHSPFQRKGPQGDRKSPFQQKSDERRSPLGDEKFRRSPLGDEKFRRSPLDDEKDRKSPNSKKGSQQYRNEERNQDNRRYGERQSSVEQRHQEDEYSHSRRSSKQGNRERTQEDRQYGERQSSIERRRQEEDYSHSRRSSKQGNGERKSPFDSAKRKSPFTQSNRNSPHDSETRRRKTQLSDDSDEHSDDSLDKSREHLQKRSSSRSGRGSVTFEDDQKHRRAQMQERRGTPSDGPLRPMLKNRTTEDGDRPTLQRQRAETEGEIRKTGRRKSIGDDDLSNSAFRPVPKPRRQSETSSVCDDLEKDPDKIQKGPPEPAKRGSKSGKGAKTEKQLLDQVIDSIDGAQEDNRMKFIQDDPDKNKKKEKQRPKSAKIHKPQPRYASGSTTPNLNDSLNTSFNSTSDIRAAVYGSWLQERNEQKKMEIKEKLRKEKEEEEKKRKAEEDKRLEAKASYNAWLESKKDFGKDKKVAKKKEEKEQKKKDEDEIEKKTTAQLAYRSWKEEKDKRLKEQAKKKKRKEEEELRKKQEEKIEKTKDSEGAFKGWKHKKDKEIVNTLKDKKTEEENNKQEEEYAKTLREEEALESYEEWMARKEKQKERERRAKLRKKHLEEDDEYYQKPWSPASRTIPIGR